MTHLKFLRLSANLTQVELQNISGVQRWKISLAEHGLYKPVFDELRSIAAFFNVDPEILLKEAAGSFCEIESKKNKASKASSSSKERL